MFSSLQALQVPLKFGGQGGELLWKGEQNNHASTYFPEQVEVCITCAGGALLKCENTSMGRILPMLWLARKSVLNCNKIQEQIFLKKKFQKNQKQQLNENHSKIVTDNKTVDKSAHEDIHQKLTVCLACKTVWPTVFPTHIRSILHPCFPSSAIFVWDELYTVYQTWMHHKRIWDIGYLSLLPNNS